MFNWLKNKSPKSPLSPSIPNLLFAGGYDMFRQRTFTKEINKLRLPEPQKTLVFGGLTALGMYVMLKSLDTAIGRLGYDGKTSDSIYNRISKDTQRTLMDDMSEELGNPHRAGVIHDAMIVPLLNRIPEYIQERINWLESGANDMPSNPGGLFSLILYQAFDGDEGKNIYGRNLQICMGLSTSIEEYAMQLMSDIPNYIEDQLRSPLGNKYLP